MAADQLALFWLLGFVSAVAVFRVVTLVPPAPLLAQERRSSLPKERSR